MIKYLALLLMSVSAFASDPWVALRASTVMLPDGSGSVVDTDSGTFILTNFHVCNSLNAPIKIMTSKGEVTGVIVRKGPLVDLCLLRASKKLPALKVSPEAPAFGSTVYNRGFPQMILHESQGEYKHRERSVLDFASVLNECPDGFHAEFQGEKMVSCTREFDYILTDIYVLPGSSGSPVVNDKGELIGVVQSHDSEYDVRAGGVIPYPNVVEFLKGN